jgi:hypothetical protein
MWAVLVINYEELLVMDLVSNKCDQLLVMKFSYWIQFSVWSYEVISILDSVLQFSYGIIIGFSY